MKAVLFALPLLLAAAMPAGAEIFRCTAGGAVTYQELPCAASASEVKVALPQSFPEVNTVERERLLAKEAAMYARLEAERERLSREKIASVQAAAQVAAAKAQAEAAAAEPVYYPAVLYRPYGPRVPGRPTPRNPSNPWSPR
ncbi:MAG TPA: DUF4124 domain-containing protein [Myxococcales bacterium]